MGEFTLLTCLVIACLCVTKAHTFCSDGVDENVRGVYGQDTKLSCRSSSPCNTIQWRNETRGSFVPPTDTVHTSVMRKGRTSFLSISTLTFDDDGSYTCWCYGSDGTVQGDSPICSVSLQTTICQASVLVNGATFMYYNNNQSSTDGNVLQVTKYDNVMIKCQKELAYLESNCSIRIDTKQGLTNVTTDKTSTCHVTCVITEGTGVSLKSCVVNIIFQVIKLSSSEQPNLNTTTTVQFERTEVFAETGTLWLVLLVLIGVVCLLFLVIVALSASIFFSRANKRLTLKESSMSVKLPPGTSSEDPFSYEDVDGGTNATATIQDVSNSCGSLNAYFTVVTDDIEQTRKHNQTFMNVEAFYSHIIN